VDKEAIREITGKSSGIFLPFLSPADVGKSPPGSNFPSSDAGEDENVVIKNQ
jgi:hypothetical protein